MPDSNLSIAPEPFDSDDARSLVADLDLEMAEFYPPEQRFGANLKAEHLDQGRGTFVVARSGGTAVGCGALRVLEPSVAEVKRMYVRPDQRGQRIAAAVLANLESAARELGVKRLVLETGVHQRAAISLYTRAGFSEVQCWGEYASSPASVCFEKRV